MIPSSTGPKPYKLDAARPGQTQARPWRQVVEAALDKTAKDDQPRVLYLKTTAPASDRPAQPYLTTKFASRHEDPQVRATQPRKLMQTQRQGAAAQLSGFSASLLKRPSVPRSAQRAAQDIHRLCTSDITQLFGLACTPELLQQLKQMESAQLAQRSPESTPRQPEHTPRSDSNPSQPCPPPDEEESGTSSPANVSMSEKSEKSEKSERSDDCPPPATGDTPRKPRPSKLVRKADAKADRQQLERARKSHIEREQRRRVKEAALDIRNLMFPKQAPLPSPRTPRHLTPVALPSPLPSSSSAPLLPTPALARAERPASETPANPLQLALRPVALTVTSDTESSREPSPPTTQSDRPKTNAEPIAVDSLRISKSQSTPASPTPPNQPPPISPRGGLKPQPLPKFYRPSLRAKQPPSTPQDTPRPPSADPSSPTTETKSETPISEQ